MSLSFKKLSSVFRCRPSRREMSVSCVSLCILIIFSVSTLTAHHTVIPTDRDEARFAQASKQMAETGDLVVLTQVIFGFLFGLFVEVGFRNPRHKKRIFKNKTFKNKERYLRFLNIRDFFNLKKNK